MVLKVFVFLFKYDIIVLVDKIYRFG